MKPCLLYLFTHTHTCTNPLTHTWARTRHTHAHTYVLTHTDTHHRRHPQFIVYSTLHSTCGPGYFFVNLIFFQVFLQTFQVLRFMVSHQFTGFLNPEMRPALSILIIYSVRHQMRTALELHQYSLVIAICSLFLSGHLHDLPHTLACAGML